MGFTLQTIRFLLAARKSGVSFTKTATIGRQGLHIDDPNALSSLLVQHGHQVTPAEAGRMLTAEKGYCEPLLRLLGAEEICSFDASSFEGATVIHDMNKPVGQEFRNRFTTVIDAGSLEHIFNFPVAISNCMGMTAPGGSLLVITPANNLMGHGFYQFSPELFFRTLTAANGFQMRRMLVAETHDRASWYEVLDPETVGCRVKLINHFPVQLFVFGQKRQDLSGLPETPQQSDYVSLWEQGKGQTFSVDDTKPKPPSSFLKRHLPQPVREVYDFLRPFRARYFKRLPDCVL